jgi:hypothetical protein
MAKSLDKPNDLTTRMFCCIILSLTRGVKNGRENL